MRFRFLYRSSRSYEVAREIVAGLATCLFGALLAVGGFQLALAGEKPFFFPSLPSPQQGQPPMPMVQPVPPGGMPIGAPPSGQPAPAQGQPFFSSQPQPGTQTFPPGDGRGMPGQQPSEYRGGPEDKKREEEYRKKYEETKGHPPGEPGRGFIPGPAPGPGQQGSPSPFFQPGPPSGGQGSDRGFDRSRQEGPGDEESRKRQEVEYEKRQKEDEKRREIEEERRKSEMKRGFSEMKRGMKQALVMVKRLAGRVASTERAGIVVPSDIKTTIDVALKTLNLILSAESFEDPGIQDAMADIQTQSEDLREAMQRIETLNTASRMLKQAQNELKRADTIFARTQRVAQRSKVDVSNQMQEFAQVVQSIKDGFAKARQLVGSGDGEAAMETLQEDVFRRMEDVYQYEGLIRALQNIRSHLTQVDRFVSNAKRIIARREKQKEDISGVKAQLEEIIGKLAEVKQLMAQKGASPDDLRDAMESLFEMQQDLSETLGIHTQPLVPPQQPSPGEFQNFSIPSFGGGVER